VLPGASNLYHSALVTGETARHGWRAGDVAPRLLLIARPLLKLGIESETACVRWIVAATCYQLLFDCHLQTAAGGVRDIGIGFHSQKNIAQHPIHPNTGQYWPIPGTPIPVSFEPHPIRFSRTFQGLEK